MKHSKTSRRAKAADKAPALFVAAPADSVSEIEALESRILLSGIGTGTNLRKASFIDADGDKVTVTATGTGATFNITLDGGATNNADINTITMNTANSNLVVTTVPVRLAPAVVGVTAGQYSGGVTYVDTITGAVNVGNINLTGVSATNIDFTGMTIANLSLNAGQAGFADRINNYIPGTCLLYTSPSPRD